MKLNRVCIQYTSALKHSTDAACSTIVEMKCDVVDYFFSEIQSYFLSLSWYSSFLFCFALKNAFSILTKYSRKSTWYMANSRIFFSASSVCTHVIAASKYNLNSYHSWNGLLQMESNSKINKSKNIFKKKYKKLIQYIVHIVSIT